MPVTDNDGRGYAGSHILHQDAMSLVLSRLQAHSGRLLRDGADRYRARCPLCDPQARKSHALAVRFHNGVLLLHCHRCEAAYTDMLAGIGLEPCDLYSHHSSDNWQPTAKTAPTPDESRRDWLEAFWGRAYPLTGHDVASLYLWNRGLRIDSYPYALRYVPEMPYYEGNTVIGGYSVMLARVVDTAGCLVTLHRTYIDRDGGDKASVNAPKKLYKAVYEGAVTGSAIRLYLATERLAVAEGIETALAVHEATGWPVWAAVSAGGLESLMLPASVSELLVAADNDSNGRGWQAGQALARRALEAGVSVRMAAPDVPGADWLDVLAAEGTSALDKLRFAPTVQAADPPRDLMRFDAMPRFDATPLASKDSLSWTAKNDLMQSWHSVCHPGRWAASKPIKWGAARGR
jgi:putative DNA primase/helicase